MTKISTILFDFQPDFVCFSPILRYFSGFFITFRIFPEKLITPLSDRIRVRVGVGVGIGIRVRVRVTVRFRGRDGIGIG